MPELFRVFPFLKGVAETKPGGALYVPSQGGGRLDNPDTYSVLYLSDSPAGAVAEAFGRFPEWTQSILEGSPSLPGTVRAIAQYQLDDDEPVCDLDDPERLVALRMRPSQVVNRDYTRSRSWARMIYEQRAWRGIRWWSYYNPAWFSFGLWDIQHLDMVQVNPLRLDHPALQEASRAIVRRIVSK